MSDDDDDGPLDHEGLKQLAQSLGRPLKSLHALALANDPFVVTPTRENAARWIAALWNRLRFQPGMHDRRMHYILVSQATPIDGPNGRPYENTLECWQALQTAVRDARYLELIPAGAVIDRRNPEPELFLSDGDDSPAEITASEGGLLRSRYDQCSGPCLWLPRLSLDRPLIEQRYHLELWCEKSTVNDVLIPLAQQYGCNVVTAVGEMSATKCEELVERARDNGGRPVRILYLSDFDPAGRSMPVAAARKIEFFIRRDAPELDVQLRPVVLSHEQCIRYQLPRTPIKESEQRAAGFEARFGQGAVELDAMEAIHPGELRRILEREIERYHDSSLDRRITSIVANVNADLHEINRHAHAEHADEIAELEQGVARIETEIERMRERIGEMEADLEERAQPIIDAIAEEIEANQPDVEDYEWPEPADADDDDDALFNSTRSYLDQIDQYRKFQGKPAETAVWHQRRKEKACEVCGRPFMTARDARFCSNACRCRHTTNRTRKR